MSDKSSLRGLTDASLLTKEELLGRGRQETHLQVLSDRIVRGNFGSRKEKVGPINVLSRRRAAVRVVEARLVGLDCQLHVVRRVDVESSYENCSMVNQHGIQEGSVRLTPLHEKA